jgi:hypothetical protein
MSEIGTLNSVCTVLSLSTSSSVVVWSASNELVAQVGLSSAGLEVRVDALDEVFSPMDTAKEIFTWETSSSHCWMVSGDGEEGCVVDGVVASTRKRFVRGVPGVFHIGSSRRAVESITADGLVKIPEPFCTVMGGAMRGGE